MAFIPGVPLPSFSPSSSSRISPSTPVCSTESPSTTSLSRRAFLLSTAAAALASVNASPAEAKNGTGLEKAFSSVFFPKEGFNAPEEGEIGATVVNKEVIASKDAQAALATIKGYEKAISDMYEKFKVDPQIEVAVPVRKLVSISDLRNALNIVNEAIDEDSQVKSDKVVRGIIQDIGELETAAYVKKGVSRTKKKIERTTDWFDKLQGDFTKLLAFYS